MISFNKWLNQNAKVEEQYVDEYFNNMLDVVGEKYDGLRRHKKPYDVALSDMSADVFSDVITASTENVKVIAQNTWAFRMNRKTMNNRPVIKERFSLNVEPDVNMIKAMDEFMAKHSDKVDSYKGAHNVSRWANRHDTVTVYCYETTKEMEKDIAKMMAPYIRKGAENEPETGTKIATGISKDFEPYKGRVDALRKKAKDVAGDLFEGVFRDRVRASDGIMSAGEYFVINKLVDDFAKDKKKINPQSIEDYKKWERGQISYDDYKEKMDGYKKKEKTPLAIIRKFMGKGR